MPNSLKSAKWKILSLYQHLEIMLMDISLSSTNMCSISLMMFRQAYTYILSHMNTVEYNKKKKLK